MPRSQLTKKNKKRKKQKWYESFFSSQKFAHGNGSEWQGMRMRRQTQVAWLASASWKIVGKAFPYVSVRRRIKWAQLLLLYIPQQDLRVKKIHFNIWMPIAHLWSFCTGLSLPYTASAHPVRNTTVILFVVPSIAWIMGQSREAVASICCCSHFGRCSGRGLKQCATKFEYLIISSKYARLSIPQIPTDCSAHIDNIFKYNVNLNDFTFEYLWLKCWSTDYKFDCFAYS